MKLLQQQQPASLLHKTSQLPVQPPVLIRHFAAGNQQNAAGQLLYGFRFYAVQARNQSFNHLKVPI
ncbi:hypothetical protein D3C73_1618870 [compost metagenome]